MRRRFNKDLLPKEPPPKGKSMKTAYNTNVGTPFQRWFKSKLKEHKITLKEFCRISGAKYPTANCWRYQNNPRPHGRMDIAWGFYLLGAGEYNERYNTIKSLCER